MLTNLARGCSRETRVEFEEVLGHLEPQGPPALQQAEAQSLRDGGARKNLYLGFFYLIARFLGFS